MLKNPQPAPDESARPAMIFLGLGWIAWHLFSMVVKFVFFLWVITALTPLASVSIPSFFQYLAAVLLSLPRISIKASAKESQ